MTRLPQQPPGKTEHQDFPTFDGVCTVTLQGGGVYGLSLLGQLKAVDDAKDKDDLHPVAYAGASAGGLVAALRWAGFSSDEIKEAFKVVVSDPAGLSSMLVASSSRHNKTKWSAKPRAVINARDRLLRLAGVEHYSGNLITRWMSFAWDMAALATFLPTAWRSWNAGGLFAADGFVEWLNRLFRERLRVEFRQAKAVLLERARQNNEDAMRTLEHLSEWLPEIGLPDPDSAEFNDHKPRFIDFDFVRHVLPNDNTHGALVLSVTNISRNEALFIDSCNAAFEHVKVADAVRATIGFPFVFQPVEISIVRERKKDGGEPLATRASLHRHRRGTSELFCSVEKFVDGGVMANFPIWAVARSLRQTLYGHTSEKPFEAIRLARAPAHQAPRRELFTRDGITIEGRSDEAVGINGFDIPLRALAFRPMLHIGLRLIDLRRPQKAPDPGNPITSGVSLGYQVAQLLTAGARSFHERLALSEGRRLILTDQLSGLPTAWQHRLLDFDKLSAQVIDEMFEHGRHFAADRLRTLRMRVSTPITRDHVAWRPLSPSSIVQKAAITAQTMLFNWVGNESDGENPRVTVRLFVVDRRNLVEVAASSTGTAMATSPKRHSLVGEIDVPELFCYHQRCAVVANPAAFWWDESRSDRTAARIVFPIVELTMGLQEPLALLPSGEPQSIMEGVLGLTDTVDSVVLGTLTIDLEVPEADAARSAVWQNLINNLCSNDEVIHAGLRVLQSDADHASVFLTEALSSASYEADRETRRRRSAEVVGGRIQGIGFSQREREFLDLFFPQEGDD